VLAAAPGPPRVSRCWKSGQSLLPLLPASSRAERTQGLPGSGDPSSPSGRPASAGRARAWCSGGCSARAAGRACGWCGPAINSMGSHLSNSWAKACPQSQLVVIWWPQTAPKENNVPMTSSTSNNLPFRTAAFHAVYAATTVDECACQQRAAVADQLTRIAYVGIAVVKSKASHRCVAQARNTACTLQCWLPAATHMVTCTSLLHRAACVAVSFYHSRSAQNGVCSRSCSPCTLSVGQGTGVIHTACAPTCSMTLPGWMRAQTAGSL
jgi:hypothetical protein